MDELEQVVTPLEQVQEETPPSIQEPVVDKVEALRGELRNGRNTGGSTGKAGKGTGRYSISTDKPTRSGNKTTKRSGATSGRNNGKSTGNKRSPVKVSKRVGSDSGRYGNDGSSLADGGIATENRGRQDNTGGGIVRIDDIPERIEAYLPVVEVPEKKPVGRPRKEETPPPPKEKRQFFRQGNVLSPQEVAEYQETLPDALEGFGTDMDRALRWYAEYPDMPPIWEGMTDTELKPIVRLLLKHGQRNPAAAQAVRKIVDASDYVSAASTLVPKFILSSEVVRNKPRKLKKGRTQ